MGSNLPEDVTEPTAPSVTATSLHSSAEHPGSEIRAFPGLVAINGNTQGEGWGEGMEGRDAERGREEEGEGHRWAPVAVCQTTLMCCSVLFQQLLGGEEKLFTAALSSLALGGRERESGWRALYFLLYLLPLIFLLQVLFTSPTLLFFY